METDVTVIITFVSCMNCVFVSAFALMISLATVRIADPTKTHGSPKLAVPSGLPALLGSCVYSFMCHHSLPGLLAPISDKSKLLSYLAIDYLAILLFYLTLSLTALFAFPKPEELYTLNFVPTGSTINMIFGFFLTSFPIMTLSTSFPIISVTLRGNLQVSPNKVTLLKYYSSAIGMSTTF